MFPIRIQPAIAAHENHVGIAGSYMLRPLIDQFAFEEHGHEVARFDWMLRPIDADAFSEDERAARCAGDRGGRPVDPNRRPWRVRDL